MKTFNTHVLLLEIIDLKERSKYSYHRDRDNTQAPCFETVLNHYTELSYPARYKGYYYRPEIRFSFYHN